MRTVVVTGMGAVTPVGIGVAQMWDSLVNGRSGVRALSRLDTAGLQVKIAAQVEGFDAGVYIDRRDAKRMDRFTQYAVSAARMAMDDAGLSNGHEMVAPERVGVCFSAGLGGLETFEEQHSRLLERGPEWVSPYLIPMLIPNIAAGHIAIVFNAQGPSTCVSTACAASAHAVADGLRLIREGAADVVIVGGAEAPITPTAVAGFAKMQALSPAQDPAAAPRPFDARRDGFVIGEGAAALVLEAEEVARARGAHIWAVFAGYGATTDAHHITAPAPGGVGAARSMAAALRNAGLSPADIDYVNAHGTGTPYNDLAETLALHTVFDSVGHVPAVSSTKSMTGHMLGAAGAMEAVVSVCALAYGVIPPTIGLEQPDPECDLDYVPLQARSAKLRAVLSNSFGFGGHNCSLVFTAAQGAAEGSGSGEPGRPAGSAEQAGAGQGEGCR